MMIYFIMLKKQKQSSTVSAFPHPSLGPDGTLVFCFPSTA